EGLSGGEVLPRRQAHHHRRGHQRDSTARDRPPDPRGRPGPVSAFGGAGRRLVTSTPLADRVLAGEPRAIARAISLIEDEDPASADLIRGLFPSTGRAYLVGVTGPPGAGKSTLVDRLVAEMRSAGRTVGVLAVDPSSPFSGGAVLG